MHTALKTMLIRPCQYIHTVLLIYTALSYGPVRLFNKSVTNWLFLYWPWYRFSVSSIGPRTYGPNTANLESIPGPIQKQPVSYTILLEDGLGTDILDFLWDSMGPLFLKPTKEFFFSVLGSWRSSNTLSNILIFWLSVLKPDNSITKASLVRHLKTS